MGLMKIGVYFRGKLSAAIKMKFSLLLVVVIEMKISIMSLKYCSNIVTNLSLT
jgi:hypothetical protein